MGNESSKLNGLVVDNAAIEANDFWTLYNAESPTTSNAEGRQYLSVFQGEPVVNGQLWLNQSPIERSIKNLMIYRHPYILKYVTNWEKGGQKYLATERVQPLVTVLSSQNDIQICLGLRTILCSLIFLVEKAMARHLNVCTASIYKTEAGSWRLAGFEYVWKQKDITTSLLNLSNSYRYQPAIDPDEGITNNMDSIEQYAFATLCEEILSKCTKNEGSIPHAQEFREYCATHLKHKISEMRPKLSAVLLHPYFNHEFVMIHSFLFELPLKNVQERKEFFAGLIDRLRYFDEEIVAAQLSANLLSRMVLLDATAQFCVTPYVLRLRADHSSALFSHSTYNRYLMPHIKKMFRMRDAQIRLILLEYFMEYVRLLTKEELEEFILPHLQTGMIDTNDVLVAKTLRCLADLIPILGSAVVLGGNRERLFSDGRPQAAMPDSTSHWVEPRSITPVLGNNVDYIVSGSPIPDSHIEFSTNQNTVTPTQIVRALNSEMPPRLSPDGGEDNKNIPSMNGDEPSVDNAISLNEIDNDKVEMHSNTEYEEEDVWSDWDTDELNRLNHNIDLSTPPFIQNNKIASPISDNNIEGPSRLPQIESKCQTKSGIPKLDNLSIGVQSQSSLSDSYHTIHSSASSATSLKQPPKVNDDLRAFDITLKTTDTLNEEKLRGEIDFFKDMEPVIDINSVGYTFANNLRTQVPKQTADEIVIRSSRLAADAVDSTTIETEPNDGWGIDDDDPVADWNA